MESNSEKCKVRHFGRANTVREFRMNDRCLGIKDDQWELGVHVHISLKAAAHANKVIKKA